MWAPGHGPVDPIWPLARGRGPRLPHLELLIELGVHIQTDEYGLCEACGGVEIAGVTEGNPPDPTLSPAPCPTGSPARANSTSNLGNVAENSTVWWPPGRRPIISCSCSANPISKSLQGEWRAGRLRKRALSPGYPQSRTPAMCCCASSVCLSFQCWGMAEPYTPSSKHSPRGLSTAIVEYNILFILRHTFWSPSPVTSPLSAFPALGDNPDSCSGVYLWPHLSASSKTTYSTLWSFRFISTATWTNRPGVPMILEGIHRSGHSRSRPSPQPSAPSATLSGKGHSINSHQ